MIALDTEMARSMYGSPVYPKLCALRDTDSHKVIRYMVYKN